MRKNNLDIDRWAAMTDEELIAMASASEVEAPRELAGRLDTLVTRLESEERRELKMHQRRVRGYSFAGFALAAASLALLLMLRTPSAQPQDTFSSPEEAYAMLETTFSHIASKTGSATLALNGSVQRIEDTINEVYR